MLKRRVLNRAKIVRIRMIWEGMMISRGLISRERGRGPLVSMVGSIRFLAMIVSLILRTKIIIISKRKKKIVRRILCKFNSSSCNSSSNSSKKIRISKNNSLLRNKMLGLIIAAILKILRMLNRKKRIKRKIAPNNKVIN